MRMFSSHATFNGWSRHYISNVYMGVKEWLENHYDFKGTAIYTQMEELRDMAKEAYENGRGLTQ